MKGITKFYFIRHGEVEETYHRVYGGRIDMALSARGHEQARKLADYLSRLQIDAVYSSPMQRVRQTVAPLNGHCAQPAIFLETLREIDFGDWTGLNFQQIRERYQAEPWEWLEWLETGKMAHAETAAQLRARLDPPLREMLARHAGKTVAVFAHGGVIRVLLSLLLELPLPKMGCFDIEYASVTEVDIIPGRGTEIQLLNFVPWKA